MALKILRMLLICFIVAGLLNVANFIVCYYIHVNRNLNEQRKLKYYWDDEEIEEPTTTKWSNDLKTMLICGQNASNCPDGFTKISNIKERDHSEATEKFNGFYYYIHDAVLTNTRFCPKVPPGLDHFHLKVWALLNPVLKNSTHHQSGQLAYVVVADDKFAKGPVKTDESLLELNAFEEMFSYIKAGGSFKPMQCIPRQSIAIIIPMRDVKRSWKNYIGTFLFYIHLFLMKQLPEYQIFIVVQVGNPKKPYARGKLLNIGFIESHKMRKNGWDCLIFHDAYYIPSDTRNLYRCTRRPRRLIATREVPKKFGGAVAIRPSVFKKVNGFSNLNWQNDGDYINMYQRLREWNYTVETTPAFIGKYTTYTTTYGRHVNLSRSEQPLDKSHSTTPIHLIDGLSSLSYKLMYAGLKQLFTFIEVDIHNTE